MNFGGYGLWVYNGSPFCCIVGTWRRISWQQQAVALCTNMLENDWLVVCKWRHQNSMLYSDLLTLARYLWMTSFVLYRTCKPFIWLTPNLMQIRGWEKGSGACYSGSGSTYFFTKHVLFLCIVNACVTISVQNGVAALWWVCQCKCWLRANNACFGLGGAPVAQPAW